MSLLSAIRVALAALLVNKGRSMLTSLGIVIGISAVIAMVAAGSGAHYYLTDRLDSVGTNLILLKPGARTQQGIVVDYTPLRMEDADAIRKQVGSLLVGVAPSQLTPRLVSTPSGHHATLLVGSTPDIQPIRNWKVAPGGRFYTNDDVQRADRVCLIGQTVRERLFPGRNPVGETLDIGRVPFRIIGILEGKGRMPTGADQDDQVFVPLTALQRYAGGTPNIDIIVASARNEGDLDRAKDQIVAVMRERHHLKPAASADFDVSTIKEMAELAVILTDTMQILTAVIASISLVVGGIGIMNIMLVSVTERTREIGIRMAIGATPGDVLVQFLIEAVVLALVGGVVGISLGMAGAVALAWWMEWPVVVQPQIVLLAFAVAAGVGVFFGYYPAYKASRLDPIDALRYE